MKTSAVRQNVNLNTINNKINAVNKENKVKTVSFTGNNLAKEVALGFGLAPLIIGLPLGGLFYINKISKPIMIRNAQNSITTFAKKISEPMTKKCETLKFEGVSNSNFKKQIQNMQKSISEGFDENVKKVIGVLNWDKIPLNDPLRIEIKTDKIDEAWNIFHRIQKENINNPIIKESADNFDKLEKQFKVLEIFSQDLDLQKLYSKQADNVQPEKMSKFLDNVLLVSDIKNALKMTDKDFIEFQNNPLYTSNSNQEIRERIIKTMPQTREESVSAFKKLLGVDLSQVEQKNLEAPTNNAEKDFKLNFDKINVYEKRMAQVKHSYENYYNLIRKINEISANTLKAEEELLGLRGNTEMQFTYAELRNLGKSVKAYKTSKEKIKGNFSEINPLSIKPDFYKSNYKIAQTKDEKTLKAYCEAQDEVIDNLNGVIDFINNGIDNYYRTTMATKKIAAELDAMRAQKAAEELDVMQAERRATEDAVIGVGLGLGATKLLF